MDCDKDCDPDLGVSQDNLHEYNSCLAASKYIKICRSSYFRVYLLLGLEGLQILYFLKIPTNYGSH